MRIFLSAALVAAALSGCATAPATMPVQNPELLRATHGFVRVTLPVADASSRFVLRAVDGGAEHELRRDPALGAQVFGAWLPAGDYAIPELSNKDGSKYLAVPVSAGRMTELGGLVPLHIGAHEIITLPIRHPEIAAEAARAVDRLGPHLSARQSIDWLPSAIPKETAIPSPSLNLGLIVDLMMAYERHVNRPPLREQLKQQTSIESMYRLALGAMPPRNEEPAVDAKGNLYFGAELGQVRVRGSDGRWSHLDTGTLQTITAVATSGARLIAGTARGTFRASDDGGRQWSQIAAVNDGEAVLDIDRIGSRWIVLTTRYTHAPHAPRLDHAEELNVYTTTNEDLGNLVLARQIKLGGRQPLIQSWIPKGQTWRDHYYVNNIHELLRLDASSMQWTAFKLPSAVTTTNVSRRNGTLTATFIAGAFSKVHVSVDGGATWLRRDNPSYPIYDVDFDAIDVGLGTRTNMGAFTSTLEFLRYDAGKDSWKTTHEAPAGCVRILRDADRAQRFCLTSGGSILNHVDGKWAVEFAAH